MRFVVMHDKATIVDGLNKSLIDSVLTTHTNDNGHGITKQPAKRSLYRFNMRVYGGGTLVVF